MKYGCLFARGDYIIFADADGATDINSLEKVLDGCKKNTKNGLSCAIGSRYEEGSDAERTAIRRFLSWGMNTLVKFVLNNDIKDTQCGFKMFTRDAAKIIFPNQHLERWAFDIEKVSSRKYQVSRREKNSSPYLVLGTFLNHLNSAQFTSPIIFLRTGFKRNKTKADPITVYTMSINWSGMAARPSSEPPLASPAINPANKLPKATERNQRPII